VIRSLIPILALLATPAAAQPYFAAEPTAKPAATRLVLRDTVWKCGEAGCSAGKSDSRPGVVCAVLAKQLGNLRSFRVDGKELSAAELEKCNARTN